MSDFSNLEKLAKGANAVTGDVHVEMTIASDAGPNQAEIDAVTAFMGAATPAAVLELIAESKRLAKKLDHNDYYCATRFETIFHWAHRELSESQKNQYFSIVANGSSYPDDPPTYAQQMNSLKWKVEAAEKERDMLKAENERLRKLPTCWSEVLEQSEANDQLLDQVLELSKDAERYRWLRTQCIPLQGHDFLSSHEILDRRVDAKILKESGVAE